MPPSAASLRSDPAPSTAESPYQHQLRAARGKRDQCLRLGTAIDVAQPEEAMVQEGSGPLLGRVAAELEQAATEIDRVPLESAGLAKLRGDFTANWRAMAGALAEAGDATAGAERKAAFARFREHESRVPVVIAELSELCNRPAS